MKTLDFITAALKKVAEDAPPHAKLFAAAKKQGLTLIIDGEREDAHKNWTTDLTEDGYDDSLKVDVLKNTKLVGSCTVRSNEDGRWVVT